MNYSFKVQRRSLLNLALERDMFSVLYSCARSWTTGGELQHLMHCINDVLCSSNP